MTLDEGNGGQILMGDEKLIVGCRQDKSSLREKAVQVLLQWRHLLEKGQGKPEAAETGLHLCECAS